MPIDLRATGKPEGPSQLTRDSRTASSGCINDPVSPNCRVEQHTAESAQQRAHMGLKCGYSQSRGTGSGAEHEEHNQECSKSVSACDRIKEIDDCMHRVEKRPYPHCETRMTAGRQGEHAAWRW